VGLAAGCGQVPTAPIATQTANTTHVGAVAESNSLLGSVGSAVGSLVNLVFKTVEIIGSLGGSLTNARWRLDIPAGAIDGNATVGIGVASSDSPQCELQITPADKNHFSTPVLLTVSCLGLSDSELSALKIFWYNPATMTWVAVEGSAVNLTSRTVSAPLQHFSTYKVATEGKAGW
jgi:hypothetical protein